MSHEPTEGATGMPVEIDRRLPVPDRRREGRRAEDKRREVLQCPHCGSWRNYVTGGEPSPVGYTRFHKCRMCRAGFSSTQTVNPVSQKSRYFRR